MENKEVTKLVERCKDVRSKSFEEIVENLSEKIFNRIEELVDKELPVLSIVFEKNANTGCIDITFDLEETESIVKSIENCDLLHLCTNITYHELTLEFWHNKMKNIDFIENETWSGKYNEDEVVFVLVR